MQQWHGCQQFNQNFLKSIPFPVKGVPGLLTVFLPASSAWWPLQSCLHWSRIVLPIRAIIFKCFSPYECDSVGASFGKTPNGTAGFPTLARPHAFTRFPPFPSPWRHGRLTVLRDDAKTVGLFDICLYFPAAYTIIFS